MAIVVKMPKLTDTMEEGVLVAWRKQEGDAISVNDVMGEVETDKATMELAAYDKGVMLKHLIAAGDSVPPGTPIAVIGKAGENIAAVLAGLGASAVEAPAESESPLAGPTTPAAPVAQPVAVASPPVASPPVARVPAPRDAEGRVLASPLARRLAREQGLDIGAVAGSGPGGRIVARDVDGSPALPAGVVSTPIAASAAHPVMPLSDVKRAQPAAAKSTLTQQLRTVELPEPQVQDGKVVPLSNMRKTIARRLTDSKTGIPHYYVTMAFDADPLVEFRHRANADATEGLKISINDLLIKAVAKALKEVPKVNSSWSEAGIVYHQRSDIGFAVAMDDGLITPVVRQADKKTLGEIATEVADLIKRARGKRLKPEEFHNGTFSISNLGMYGVSHFAAVINPPEAAILAVGAVQKLPVVRGDVVVPGNVLKVTMSCDHRIIDGAVAAQFLAALRELVEHPMRLVI